MSKKSNASATSMASRISLMLKTGKCYKGYRQAYMSLIRSECKYLILTPNYPTLKKSLLEYYAMQRGVPIYMVDSNNKELAISIGINHRTGVIAVLDEGEADFVSCR